jgi:glycine cleavage system H protein
MDDGTLRIGITDHAQHALGDMVYVDLPKVGKSYAARAECAVVESVKSASDLYAPVAGEVVEVNEALSNKPEIINQDPYGEGWIFRLKPEDANAIQGLLDAKGYAEVIAQEE